MTVYVDDPMPVGGKYNNWCHMWSDGSMEELEEMARTLKLNKKSLQHSYGRMGDWWHYDIAPGKRNAALSKGAVYIPLKQWLKSRYKAVMVRSALALQMIERMIDEVG